MNCQSGSLLLLFQLKKKESQIALENEVSATPGEIGIREGRRRTEQTTLEKAFENGDLKSIQLLRDEGNAKLVGLSIHKFIREPEILLRELYPGKSEEFLSSWSKAMHWSFPIRDRRMINWIWFCVANNRRRSILNDNEHQESSSDFLPPELWLRVLSFVGRRWWTSNEVGGYRL